MPRPGFTCIRLVKTLVVLGQVAISLVAGPSPRLGGSLIGEHHAGKARGKTQ